MLNRVLAGTKDIYFPLEAIACLPCVLQLTFQSGDTLFERSQLCRALVTGILLGPSVSLPFL